MDSKTYDEIRNLTLLFFLDRLIDKGQPRTLHDLSCQFGTKGFTKEMRQIAGGSQSGLRKFFSKYPSLFTIDGEYVSITCYNVSSGSGTRPTSANANSHNANDSGAGDSGGGSGSGGRDYAVEAVSYFKDKLEQYGEAEVPIRSLLGHRSQAMPEVRHISGQHIKEFKDFLGRYPDIFVVREEYVVLRKHWDAICDRGGVLEKREPSPVANSTVEVDSQATTEIVNLCRTIISNHNNGSVSIEALYNQLKQEYNQRGNQPSISVKNARDLGILLKMHSDSFLVQSGSVSLVPWKNSYSRPVNASVNSTVNGSGPETRVNQVPSTVNRQNPPTNQSFKQRLVTHLIKAMADNSAMEQRVYQSPSAPAAGHHRPGSPLNSSSNLPLGFDVELMNSRLLKATKLITKTRDCLALVSHLKANSTIISLDAEGVNLGPNGPMTLLQVGTSNGNIFILDLVACREMLLDGGMKEILESPQITKVVHDCRNDSAALHYQFGITLNNVFDTQAAHAVILKSSTNKPVHKVKNISLNNLCRTYGAHLINPKKEQMKKLYRRDQRFWSRRPLTDDMVLYAAYDICALVPTIYDTMSALLTNQEDLVLFNQLCWEQVNCYLKVEEVKLSKKQRKNESEIEELKKKLSQTSGKSVVLSNREIRLLRNVNLTEEEREKLEGSYKVAQKLERIQSRLNPSLTPSGSRSNADSSEASPDFDEDEDYELEDLSGTRDELEPLSENGSRASSPSFEESIRMVEEFLVNDRYDRLQGILQDETCGILSGFDDVCNCVCHVKNDEPAPKTMTVNVACQTMSTGDVVITKVHFEDMTSVTSSSSNHELTN